MSSTLTQPVQATEVLQVDPNSPISVNVDPVINQDISNFNKINEKFMDSKVKFDDLKPEEQKEYVKEYNKIMWDL